MSWMAAASAADSAIGGGMSWGMNASENKKSRRWAEDQANKAWTRNVQMWNVQNEYNSPSAQMKRFEEAGLNPHLAVSGGDPGKASTMPTYNEPRGKFGLGNLPKLNAMQGWVDYKMKENANKNLELTGEGIVQDNRKKDILNDILDDLKDDRKTWEQSKYQNQAKTYKIDQEMKKLKRDWQSFKNKNFEEYGMNIDQDQLWVRFLGQMLGKVTDEGGKGLWKFLGM